MNIFYLADKLEQIPDLAEWHYDMWGHLGQGKTLDTTIAGLHKKAGRCEIPTTFVVMEGDTLLGSASIVENDLSTHPELTPWLASVYVGAEYRNRGIGSVVVQRVMAEAQTLSVKRLYLITPDQQNFYARMGWTAQEEVSYRGEEVTIMTWDPTP